MTGSAQLCDCSVADLHLWRAVPREASHRQRDEPVSIWLCRLFIVYEVALSAIVACEDMVTRQSEPSPTDDTVLLELTFIAIASGFATSARGQERTLPGQNAPGSDLSNRCAHY
jgi:hypothetical protein